MEALVRITALIAGTAPFAASVLLDSTWGLQIGSAVWGLVVVITVAMKS